MLFHIYSINLLLIFGECVEKILGHGDARQKYQQMKHEDWLKALMRQLDNSGLKNAISQLTEGIINGAHGHALQHNGRKLMNVMRKVAGEQRFVLFRTVSSRTTVTPRLNVCGRRALVEIVRSRNETEQAYEEFQHAQYEFKGFRRICEEQSKELKRKVRGKLDRAYAILEQSGQKSAVIAVETAAKGAKHHAPKVRISWSKLDYYFYL